MSPETDQTQGVNYLSRREITFRWLSKFRQRFPFSPFPAVLLFCSEDSLPSICLHCMLRQMLSLTYFGCCAQPTYSGAISSRLQAEVLCRARADDRAAADTGFSEQPGGHALLQGIQRGPCCTRPGPAWGIILIPWARSTALSCVVLQLE